MIHKFKRGALLVPFLAPLLVSACVSQKDYDAQVTRNQQIEQQLAAESAAKRQLQQQVSADQQQMAADKTQIGRLTGAIRYTVNSDLLFPSGDWRMSADGQRVIARLASQLAPTQQQKVGVNGYTDNQPIGAQLHRRGIASNDDLSQRRAQTVMEYMVTQGVKPDLVMAKGL